MQAMSQMLRLLRLTASGLDKPPGDFLLADGLPVPPDCADLFAIIDSIQVSGCLNQLRLTVGTTSDSHSNGCRLSCQRRRYSSFAAYQPSLY